MAILLLLTLRQVGRVRGARHWLWSTLMVSIAVVLNASRDVVPELIGVVVSHTLIVVGSLVSARGTFEYRYRRLFPLKPYYAAAAATFCLVAYSVYVAPSLGAQRLVVACTISSVCSWHVWILLAGSALRPLAANVQNPRFRLPHGIMALGLAIMATVFFVVIADTLRSLSMTLALVSMQSSPRLVLFFYVAGIIGRVLVLIGMVLVLIDELDHALRALAFRDPLTGLFNRRGFHVATTSLSFAHGSLLMLDLDRFKSVNDEFGYEQGDRVIAMFARSAQAQLPLNAVIARLGGEEFCARLPHVDHVAATASAETLRTAF